MVARKISQMKKGKEASGRQLNGAGEIGKRNRERTTICQTGLFLLACPQLQDPLNLFGFFFVVPSHLLQFWRGELQCRTSNCKQVENSN